MPLLNTTALISPASLYPDKIQLNFQVMHGIAVHALRSAFDRRGIRPIGPNKWASTIALGDDALPSSSSCPVIYSHIVPAGVTNCFVTINVLTQHHRPAVGRDAEIPSQRRARNWLHPDDVSDDNRHLWDFIDRQIPLIQAYLENFFREIGEEEWSPSRARLIANPPQRLVRSVTVSNVELCVDIRCENPRRFVHGLAPTFAAYLSDVDERPYGLSAPYVERLGAGHMVSGTRRQHERYKAYCKTSRRVRLECTLGYQALRALDIARRIGHQGTTFRSVFQACADHCAPQLTNLLAQNRSIFNIDSSRTPYDLISIIVARVRDPHKCREFLDRLLSEGCIHYSFDRQLIANLKALEPRVLVDSWARGYSTIAPEFRRAAWQLRSAQWTFSAASSRRRLTNTGAIRGAARRSGSSR